MPTFMFLSYFAGLWVSYAAIAHHFARAVAVLVAVLDIVAPIVVSAATDRLPPPHASPVTRIINARVVDPVVLCETRPVHP